MSSDGGRTWTYTFSAGGAFTEASGSLVDGVYALTLHASKVTAGGVSMAADYTLAFHRLFADADGDTDVDGGDGRQFRRRFGTGL